MQRSKGGLEGGFGSHLGTRRWCATVRRGRHTKSTRGYSGHVTATQKGEEEEEEVLGFEAGEGYFRLRSTALFYSFSQPASP